MYKKREAQIIIDEFVSPFGQLDQNNRWVRKSKLFPWQQVEEKYAKLFESDTGNVAKPVRMAVGASIIKQEKGLSDEGVLEAILENPYMQFFIGLHEFTTKAPFAATTMVYFRKRLTGDALSQPGQPGARKVLGIRLSGPGLRRPPKGAPADPYARKDNSMGNWVESKFGEEKTCYGLGHLFSRLQETSEFAIHMASFVANLNRGLRLLFARFADWRSCWVVLEVVAC